MAKMFWKKKKTIAMLLNKRQWLRDFDPTESAGYEIEIEQGGSYIITQSSNPATPTYIIKE
jgi:predicted DNA-binding transcriptional regulator YafY